MVGKKGPDDPPSEDGGRARERLAQFERLHGRDPEEEPDDAEGTDGEDPRSDEEREDDREREDDEADRWPGRGEDAGGEGDGGEEGR